METLHVRIVNRIPPLRRLQISGKLSDLLVEAAVTVVGGEVVLYVIREVLRRDDTTRSTPPILKLTRLQTLNSLLVHPRTRQYVISCGDIRAIFQQWS